MTRNIASRPGIFGAVDGGGKGAHAVVMALSTITGKPLLGEHVWRTGPVAIISYEDNETERRRPIAAACIHYRLDYDSVCRSFHFIHRPSGRIVFRDDDAIIAEVKAIKAILLIVIRSTTLTRSMTATAM